MYIWKKDPGFYFDYDLNRTKDLKVELDLIKEYFEKYDELSVEDKKNLILHFMNLDYDTRDICLITNLITKAGHDMIMEIPTKMEYSYLHTEGRGRDFSYWDVFKEVNYLVTTREDLNLEKRRYSFNEMMKMYYTREICPILRFDKELNKFSDDKESVKKITTLKDIGIDVNPYPEFEQFDIMFDDSNTAQEFQNMLFKEGRLNKDIMDSCVKHYLDRLIDYAKYGAYYSDEKKMTKKLYKYRDSKVK